MGEGGRKKRITYIKIQNGITLSILLSEIIKTFLLFWISFHVIPLSVARANTHTLPYPFVNFLFFFSIIAAE